MFNVKLAKRTVLCLALLGAVLVPATSYAAEIHVNRAQWEAASEEQRAQIVADLNETKSLSSDDTIVADDGAEAATDSNDPRADDSTTCRAVCSAEAIAGGLRCAKYPISQMKQACRAVVLISYAVCLAGC